MVTLTLVGHHLRLDIPELLDVVEDITQPEEKKGEAGEHSMAQIQPTAMKVAETISGPILSSDVNAGLNGEQLTLTMWKRLGGLRLAPLRLNVK